MPNSKTKPMVTRNFQSLLAMILLVFSYQLAQAGGPMGGEIRYSYLNTSGDYEVTLVLYQTESTKASNQPVEVLLNSTCYGSDTLLMSPFVPSGMTGTSSGGVRFSADAYCVDSLVEDSLGLLAFHYRDTVKLPGNCGDYSFSYQQCCRDTVIDNIAQPGSSVLYLNAMLNNTHGPNTSTKLSRGSYGLPRFLFYKNITSYSSFGFGEPDNDSVLATLVSAVASNGSPVMYAPGYSFINPMPSTTPFSGAITPTEVGEFTMVFEIKEYRYLQAGFWTQVGSSMFDVAYVIRDSFPDRLVSTAFGGSQVLDTISNVTAEDSIISFTLKEFQLSSLTPDGSEFRIIGSDGVVRPVVGAGCLNPGTNLLGDSIWLKIHGIIKKNDTLQIQLKRGSDGNTLMNACGNEFTNFDNGILIIKKAQFIDLSENPNSKPFSVYPNPTKDKIMIEVDEGETPERITLFDIQGRELKSVIPQSYKTEIDISMLSKGMYLLKVSSGGLQQTRLIQKH